MIFRLKPFFLSPWSVLVTLLFWAVIVYMSFINRSLMLDKIELEMARFKGETVFHLIQTTRRWNTLHGVVYVPETEDTPQNPYLFVPEKNITTPSGRALTQVNPAYMTRQLAALLEGGAIEISLTSQQLLNQQNAPDSWELDALKRFEREGLTSIESQMDDRFRYMAPLYIEPGCQACHFGYAVGDIRGGLSVTFPKSSIQGVTGELRKQMIFLHLGAFFILSIIGVFLALSIRNMLLNKEESDRLKQLNDALAEQHRQQVSLTEDLMETRAQAEKASAAKSEFLATMSHEVRTPMNAILGLLEILSKESLTAKQQGLIKVVRQSARVLMRILDDILDFSRLEAGKITQEVIPINLRDILDGITEIFKPMCDEKGVVFVTEVDPDLPSYVYADPVRISQILHNLISNAVKFSSTDKASSGHVRVMLNWQNEQLEIVVKDNGIGISSEQISTILEPFTQAEISTTRKFGGSGLGLSIVQKLVQMMKGELKVESALGEGSVFSVSLPLLKLNASELSALAIDVKKATRSSAHHPADFHLLVAEDDKVNQLVIGQQLEKMGYPYTMVNDGAEALDLWKGDPDRFDLLITDLHMPNMDGLTLIKSLREQSAKGASLPIIMLTANAMSMASETAELNLSGKLTKPVQLHLFEAALASTLESRSPQQSSRTESKTKPVSTPVQETLPAYDPDALKQVVGDDPDTLKELQETYIVVSAEQMQQLGSIWQSEQSDQRVILLHKLKSSSRSTGLMRLGERFEYYEQLCRQKTSPLKEDEFLQLKAIYEEAVALLRSASER